MGIQICLSAKLSTWKKIGSCFFFWPKCFYRVSLLMYVKWEKVKMGERDMFSLKDQNIGLSIILQVQNEKRAIDLYSGKEIFIR